MSKSIACLAVVIGALLVLPARGDEPADKPSGGPSDKKPSQADGSDPATMFVGLDANKDGQLSADEVPEAHRRLFERLLRTADADRDGKLTSQEFAAGLKGPPDKADAPRGRERAEGKRPDGRPGPGKLFKRMDANGDGKVVLDEIPEERREMFKKLLARGDKDADGALTREELVQALADGGDAKPDKPKPDKPKPEKSTPDKSKPEGPKAAKGQEGRGEPAQFFRRLDANGDGKIVLDEVPERLRPRIEQLIKRADADGDQAVSLEEFIALGPPGRAPEGRPGQPRPERPGGPGERGFPPAGLFRALDTDRDGKLSGEEISAAAEILRKLDADGDGSVTIEELMAARPAREDK